MLRALTRRLLKLLLWLMLASALLVLVPAVLLWSLLLVSLAKRTPEPRPGTA